MRLDSSQDGVADRLGEAVDRLDETIVQIRTTIFALRSSSLGPAAAVVAAATIRERVVNIVAESARALGFEPDVLFPGDATARVPADIAEHLLVVVREGLTNVARHAHAAQATVAVGDEVVARVADDGVGRARARSDGARYGLANMRERARSVGGMSRSRLPARVAPCSNGAWRHDRPDQLAQPGR